MLKNEEIFSSPQEQTDSQNITSSYETSQNLTSPKSMV